MAIDPENDTLYLTLGNPTPDFLGEVRKGKNLYTDSMVVLDISGSSPKMKWYYQFIGHDTHDDDPAMPPVLFTRIVNGGRMKLAAAGDNRERKSGTGVGELAHERQWIDFAFQRHEA